jgi:hypothetical protein
MVQTKKKKQEIPKGEDAQPEINYVCSPDETVIHLVYAHALADYAKSKFSQSFLCCLATKRKSTLSENSC